MPILLEFTFQEAAVKADQGGALDNPRVEETVV
jgi:hypothetical protein